MIKRKAAIFFILLANVMLLAHTVIAHHHHQDDTTAAAVEISSKHHHTNSNQENHSHKSPVEKDHNIPTENQHDHDFPQHYHISVTNDFDYLRTNLQQSNNQNKKESLNPAFIFFLCDYFEQSLDPPIKRNGNIPFLIASLYSKSAITLRGPPTV